MARKATDGATGVVRVTVLLTPEQKAVRLPGIGGSATIRRLIDEEFSRVSGAQEPKPQRRGRAALK